jgi:hypothetical protein
MDAIWLCVTTLLLHVLINRLFGRLRGWPRAGHWPAMQLAAMAAHAAFSSAPMFWLLQLIRPLTNLSAAGADLTASVLAAAVAALILRRWVQHRRAAV